MISVHYFASIREVLNKSRDDMELPDSVKTVSDLVTHLGASNPEFQALIDGERQVLVAVNQTVVGREHKLSANDEVAFFPPMTGG